MYTYNFYYTHTTDDYGIDDDYMSIKANSYKEAYMLFEEEMIDCCEPEYLYDEMVTDDCSISIDEELFDTIYKSIRLFRNCDFNSRITVNFNITFEIFGNFNISQLIAKCRVGISGDVNFIVETKDTEGLYRHLTIQHSGFFKQREQGK